MAAPLVTEDISKGTMQESAASGSAGGGGGGATSRTATRVFSVLAASDYQAFSRALQFAGLIMGVRYRNWKGESPWPDCVMTGWQTQVVAVGQLYDITVNYANEEAGKSGVNGPGAVTSYQWSGGLLEVPILIDIDGKKVEASNKDPFANATEDVPTLALSVSFVRRGYTPATYVPYLGAINSDNWLGLEPGMGRCFGVFPDKAIYRGFKNLLMRLTARFEFRQLVKTGTRQTSPWQLIHVDQDKDGNRLDGKGKLLAKEKESVFLSFNRCRSMPFKALGI